MSEVSNFVAVTQLETLREDACTVVHANGHTVALFLHEGTVHALDNRCPHMGFPLERGTVQDGILTCHWHHARFDLRSGGTFDPWADDVRTYEVKICNGEVYVNVGTEADAREHQRNRLQVGLERNLSLVIAKAVLVLGGDGSPGEYEGPVEPYRDGLLFGTRFRRRGWGQGLTMHTCFMNLVPRLRANDRPRALYHGLSAVASETAGAAPRFQLRPLPGPTEGLPALKRWFRRFIEVRDSEGAERCVVSAVRSGAGSQEMADMLFSAVTDHRYIDAGHPADFTNKAFEALDTAGWQYAESTLTSLVPGYAMAERMEESNSWRNPVDLVSILEGAFEELFALDFDLDEDSKSTLYIEELMPVLHGDDAQAIADGLLAALREGRAPLQLALNVSYAAALRVARFHTSNEFGDWDTALHTFTFANAVAQGMRRAPSKELLRGVFDAAMSIYLDRFLNIPAARLPQDGDLDLSPDGVLAQFPDLLNQQQRVNEAGTMVATFLNNGGNAEPLMAKIGQLLLREDRDFHTIQMVEAAFRQYEAWSNSEVATNILIAAARYLAAHSPTVRSQGQTYDIASRLHRGDKIFEGG